MSMTPSAAIMKSTILRFAGIAAVLVGLFQGGSPAAAAGARPAAQTLAVADCNWNHPGANPFMGDVVAAVDRYQDIAPAVRARLKARMSRRDYDEIVEIRRDSIAGRDDYGSEIADMHFGTSQLCHRVTRTAWSAQMQERGLVYCEQDQCLLVPTVCRNVSRIRRGAVHREPVHSIFAPGPALVFGPASDADTHELLPAGPIGWAPGVPGASSVPGGTGRATGLAFARSSGGGGIGGSGDGTVRALAAYTGVSKDAIAIEGSGPRQSSYIVGSETDRLAPIDVGLSTLTAPVPEPQTWVSLAFGLLVLARLAARRRRSTPRG